MTYIVGTVLVYMYWVYLFDLSLSFDVGVICACVKCGSQGE
jgi:hypothetical protein